MDAIVTVFIALMPLFAMLPLALGAVIAVALVVSPRTREALADWTRRRLRLDAPARSEADERVIGELRAEVRRLEERVGFVERVMALQPRPATPPGLAAASRPTTPHPPA